MRVAAFVAIISAVSSAAWGQSLQQQEACARQAKLAFEEYNSLNHNPLADYQSHYNTKLNKCLILIDDQMVPSGKEFLTTAMLMDAFERRVYGSYSWRSQPNKKYWEVPPITCELIPTTREKTFCRSRDEFDAFVSKYMEEQ